MRLTKSEQKMILDTIENIFGEVEVFLFGSRLDMLKKGGDIDLFVVSKETKNLYAKKIKALARLERLLHKPVDIVVHKDAERTIEKEILRANILLGQF